MKKRNVYIAVLPDGRFFSAGTSWSRLDMVAVVESLAKAGYEARLISVTGIEDIPLKKDDVVFYTSSDEGSIRSYLKDIMYFVSLRCEIVPSYEILLSHENKGFQQLLRSYKGFGGLCGGYFFDLDEVGASYPFVYKKITGAGSAGVALVRGPKDLNDVRRRDYSLGIKRRLIKLQRKSKLTKSEYSIYAYRHKGFSLAVWQEFVDGLAFDYKVLVFGDRYFVLKRNVRNGDFRASGSGDFSFASAPDLVLNYAREVFLELGSPYVSLDIAVKDDKCYLIEYQGLNFGPYTMLNSKEYYFLDSAGKWMAAPVDFSLEDCFANAMAFHLGGR
ncbi:MAG: hypothetical protein VW877_05180 [Pseudomonadaceae bacterium]